MPKNAAQFWDLAGLFDPCPNDSSCLGSTKKNVVPGSNLEKSERI